MNKGLILLTTIVGVALLVVGFMYFTTPAQSLPAFLPGYQIGLTKIHRTHAIASFLLAFVSFVFAWFQSGKKSPK